MNRIYRSIWNASRATWVAAAEITKARGKCGGPERVTMVAVLVLSLAPLQRAAAASVTWDPNGAAAGSGGAGTWDTTSTQWFNGTTFGAWNNGAFDDAVFNAAAAPLAGNTVTLSGTINAHSITFNAGYVLSGGTLNLGGSAPTLSSVVNGTINSVITGTAGFTKTGAGGLILGGANTYTGGTRLQQGALQLNSATALGPSTAAADFDVSAGTTVIWGSGLTFNYNLTAHGGTVSFGGTGAGTWAGTPTVTANTVFDVSAGTYSGNWADSPGGALSVIARSMTFSGTNTYSGQTSVPGVLTLNSAGALSPNSNLLFNGALGSLAHLVLSPAFPSFTRGLGTGAGQVQWTGDGGFVAANGTQTVNIGGAGAPLSWGVTPGFVPTGSQLVVGSVGTGTLDFQNGLVLPTAGTNYQLQVIGGTLANHPRISGQLTGAGNLSVMGTAGLVELANANNTYSGSLVLASSGADVMLGQAGSASSVGGITGTGAPNQSWNVAEGSPEVSLNNSLGALAQLWSVQSLGTWHTRLGAADINLAEASSGGGTQTSMPAQRDGIYRMSTMQLLDGSDADANANGSAWSELARRGIHTWARTFGAHADIERGGLQAGGADFNYNSLGLQAGADIRLSRNGPIEDRVGGYVSGGSLRAKVKHFDGSDAGDDSLRAYAVGGYWSRISKEGWYLDAVAQLTRFDQVRSVSLQGIRADTSGWGVAASLEAGKAYKLNDDWSIEPQAQLIVQHNHLNDVTDSNLTLVGLGSGTSVLGRVGARVVRKWYEPGSTVATGSAWVRLNAWHEFSGDTSVSYQTAAGPLAFDSHMRGTWGELEVGFSHAISSSTSIFASLDYQHSVNGAGREGGSFSAGVADGGLPAVGLGLSTQLSPNARLSTKASYGTGGKGQPNVAATMVELALKW